MPANLYGEGEQSVFPPCVGLENPGPFRREALAACRPSSWYGPVELVRKSVAGLLALGVLLPKLVTRPHFGRIHREKGRTAALIRYFSAAKPIVSAET
jgi:hypothetical protein